MSGLPELGAADLVILAVPFSCYAGLAADTAPLLAGKVVVDVSNRWRQCASRAADDPSVSQSVFIITEKAPNRAFT